MFRKLVKYEWMAMARAMFPIYGALLAVSLLNSLLGGYIFSPDGLAGELPWLGYLKGLATLLYGAVMVAVFVFELIITIQRFYRGLLKQEGYLMFTLPVKTWQLALSKAVVAWLIGLCSMAVGALSVGILGGWDFLRVLIDLPQALFELVRQALFQEPEAFAHLMFFGIELLIGFTVGNFVFLYHLYLAMCLGQLSKNHKAAFSVCWYVAIMVLLYIVQILFLNQLPGMLDVLERVSWDHSYLFLHLIGGSYILQSLVKLAIFAGGTGYVLEKKLNLE